MPIGGFNGSDPSPTLAQFQAYVAAGKIHYFIGGRLRRPTAGSDARARSPRGWLPTSPPGRSVG